MKIDQGKFTLPPTILSQPTAYKREIKYYKNWIYETSKLLNTKQNTDEVFKQIKELVDFEIGLIKSTQIKDRMVRMTTRQFSERFKIDLTVFLNRLFQDTNITITNNDVIVLMCENYLKRVVKLVSKTRTRILSNYIIWCVIKELARDASAKLRRLSYVVDKAILGVKEDVGNEEECVGKTVEFLGYSLIPKYAEEYLDLSAIETVEKMAGEIQTEFIALLDGNAWLGGKTKRLAIEKIGATKFFVGFPSWAGNEPKLEKYYNDLDITGNYFVNVLKLRKRRVKIELHYLVKSTGDVLE